MDREMMIRLEVLEKINSDLMSGLKAAAFVMEEWDGLTADKRQSAIEYTKKLVLMSEKVSGSAFTC